MVDILHDHIVETPFQAGTKDGRVFRLAEIISVTTATKRYLRIALGESSIEILRFKMVVKASAEVIVTVFGGSDISGGTPLTFFNNNSGSGNTSKTVATLDPTVTDVGSPQNVFPLYGSDSVGQQIDIGGNETETDYSIHDSGTELLIEIDNKGATTDFHLKLFISEQNPTLP